MIAVMGDKTTRNFNDSDGRLVSRSLQEIRDAMDRETTRVLRTYNPRVGVQSFSLTAAVNAVISGYLRLPQDVRDRIILDGAGECQRLLEESHPDTKAFANVDSNERRRSVGADPNEVTVGLIPNLESVNAGSVGAVPASQEFEGPPIPDTGVGPGRLLDDPKPDRKRPRKAK